MCNGYRTIFAGAVFLISLAAPAANSADDEESSCLERLTAVGQPHRLKMVAELNAMRAWIVRSQDKGEAYGMWHNAHGIQVSCEQLERSVYYSCTAAARPCPPRQVRVGTEE